MVKVNNHGNFNILSNTPHNQKILRSKLYIPRIPSNLVSRMRLIKQLGKDPERPLTLVLAPTGYGKSMLIAQWLQDINQPSTWISLNEKDNDLLLFLNYVHSAIEMIFPEKCTNSKKLLEASPLPEVDDICTALVNDISQLKEQFILVLDDYQLISNTKIHNLIKGLLRHPVRKMHLVVISKNAPPFPIIHYLSKNLMTKISIEELRFTVDETRELLEKCIPGKFDEMIVEPLANKMEGWVTGMSLTILSLQDDQYLTIEDVSNSSAYYLQEYLTNEVTKNIRPEIAQHLLHCSVLDEFCAPLANHISSNTNFRNVKLGNRPTDFLLNLDKSHLFLNCTDCNNSWCKIHPLFKDFLQNKMAKEWSDEDLANLHLSASIWFEENGFAKEAIKHSYLSGDKEKAHTIFENNKYKELKGGKWADLEKWLERLPDEIKKNHPITLPSTLLTFKTASGAPSKLTRREGEVLNLIAQGLSNKEIASTLNLSAETIKKHIYRIFQKLNTHSRTETIRKASEVGILLRQN
jgi:LuxR family maltose regulon positive regulatory protein